MSLYIMQYIIPASLTFIFGIVLWQIKRTRVQLDYEIIKSEPFPSEKGTSKYYIIRLRNFGNTEVKNTHLKIVFSNGTIESKRFSDKDLITDIEETESEFTGLIPLLNPKEILSTTITATGEEHISTPKVSARAPGTSATLKNDDILTNQILHALFAVIISCGITMSISIYNSYKTSKAPNSLEIFQEIDDLADNYRVKSKDFLQEIEQDQVNITKKREERLLKGKEEKRKYELQLKNIQGGKPRAEQLVFAIFNRAQLSHKFTQLVEKSEGISYWRTGSFILNSFLVDRENSDKYIAAAEALIEIKEMAPSSYGFNLYLLAKMEQFNGNKEKAIKWFELCKKETPLMYDHLMTQDPTFDLNNLQRDLLSKNN